MHNRFIRLNCLNRIFRTAWLPTLLIAWAVGLSVAFCLLVDYDTRPAPRVTSPEVWPMESPLEKSRDQWTLLMFVHPRCPCSQAGLEELSHVMERASPGLKGYVIYLQPPQATPDWEHLPIVDGARRIPRMSVFSDQAGIESRRFGVHTSGHTLLYNPNGELAFSGGLTAGRGHYGENASSLKLAAILQGALADPQRTEVYGCALRSSGEPK